MNFQVISDLYVDGNRYEKFRICGKNLIIAGSLGQIGQDYTRLIKIFCLYYERVILVPGIYEYIGREMSEVKKYFAELTRENPKLVVLDNTSIEIGGMVIFGSTFWSHVLSDPFEDIRIVGKRITRLEWNGLHYQSILALEKTISSLDNKTLVVVTHFSPLGTESIHPSYRGGASDADRERNLFYYSDTVLQNEKRVKMWIYGRSGYNFSDGKFISNQLVSGGSLELIVGINPIQN